MRSTLPVDVKFGIKVDDRAAHVLSPNGRHGGSGTMLRISRQPTVPAPPPPGVAAALRRPASGDNFVSVKPYRLPLDLLDHVEPALVKEIAAANTTTRSSMARTRADVLSIFDEACRARETAIRSSGIRLHLSAAPSLPLGKNVVEHTLGTLLDVALAAGNAGRVDIIARERGGAEFIVACASSRHSSAGVVTHEPVGGVPSVVAKLDECRSLIDQLGGSVKVDSDEFCTTVRVSVPIEEIVVPQVRLRAAG